MHCRWYVYVLRDPISWDVRYVGRTNRPALRLKHHLTNASRATTASGRWVQSLKLRGLKPMLEVIDAGMGNGFRAAERVWVAEFRSRGADLLNRSQGGDGPNFGRELTQDVRDKLSVALKGKRMSDDAIRRMAETKRGQKQSPEHVANRVAKLVGHVTPDVTRRRISEALTGHVLSDECRAKIAATLMGRRPSEETRAKLRAAQKARRERERLRRTGEST